MMRAQTIRAALLLAIAVFCRQDLGAKAAETPRPRKIVLIAGPLDRSHPPATHEYEKTVQLIKHCLDHSPNVKGVRTEIHFNGWPRNPGTLDTADTIVLVTSGAGGRGVDHPLLQGDRMKVIDKQMKRGCGLVLIHWSVFVPQGEVAEHILDWVGGHFDYESGPRPQGWYSKIKTAPSRLIPKRGHPICRGVESFQVQEELYYNIRFRPHDTRLTPILRAAIPGEKEEQTVAWAVERRDGGRGFGFTGSHFFANWENDSFRRCLLQAILWTAHVSIPEGGVKSRAPTPEQLSEVFPGEPVTLAPGRFGQALDARASAVLIPGDERYRWPPLTLECWARLHSAKKRNVLVSCDPKTSAHHWEVYTHPESGAFSAFITGALPSECVSTANVCDDRWHYLAMTFDGKDVTLFVDGKLVHEETVQPRAGLRDVPGPLRIGQSGGGERGGCDGLIDEVRLSSTLRTIASVPESELPKDRRTVGMWRFDQSEGFQGDPDWTPPPVAGKAEPWEKETDADWIDGRFRLMDTGPFLDHTFAYTHAGSRIWSYKGTAIRLGKDAAVLFDRNQLRLAAAWTGGYVQHSSHRFGLLNTPTPAGPIAFSTASGPGWSRPDGKWDDPPAPTAPLPREWARFRGLYVHGPHVVLSYSVGKSDVLETHDAGTKDGLTVFRRTVETGPSETPLNMLAAELPAEGRTQTIEGITFMAARQGKSWTALALVGEPGLASLSRAGMRVLVQLPKSRQSRRFAVLMASGTGVDLTPFARRVKASGPPEDLNAWMKPGPALWTRPIVTTGERAPDNAPYVIDTLTVPYDNPYRALFFISGMDFLPSGDIAVCTAHGDVWIVRGADEQLKQLTWQRFATGLYQPLGLRVVDGKIHVIERGQLTRLHDIDNNGEADYYENVNNNWHTGGGEHSFDCCLEVDSDGNFYFFKTGEAHTPTGGCLLRVSRDGKHREVFATGFRQPVGLSVSPTGVVTGADQEGNWMPATRIDIYRKGGFYGDMRTHHRTPPPGNYDPPLCWLPREADSSAGGQVWVPPGKLGPLGGHALHLSYGRCRALLLLPQLKGTFHQGGAVDLGLFFLSGVLVGRVHPKDDNLYVVGLRGWQTAARRDGCLQRVRYTGKPVALPVEMAVEPGGIRLRFSQPLAPKAGDRSRYRIEQWGYRWSGEYGSKHYSVREPDRPGQDPVKVDAVTLSADGRSVLLGIADLRPVMQMKIAYDIETAAGRPCVGTVYNTINWVPRVNP
jgi:hypothetical protein